MRYGPSTRTGHLRYRGVLPVEHELTALRPVRYGAVITIRPFGLSEFSQPANSHRRTKVALSIQAFDLSLVFFVHVCPADLHCRRDLVIVVVQFLGEQVEPPDLRDLREFRVADVDL